jgi:Mn2+/Fe2+ NRAMP family transporter
MSEQGQHGGTQPTSGKSAVWRAIGPGICMAGAAIGVSHFMQSTRAGAEYGWQLLVLLLAVNIFKYPFFEFGHRYAAGTGQSLLHGYARLGKPYLGIFVGISLLVSLGTVAGVTFLTAVLAENLVPGDVGAKAWSALLIGGCVILLIFGRYRALDRLLKVLMGTLAVTTLVAFVAVFFQPPAQAAIEEFSGPSPWTFKALPFLIALMGWMPAPIEVSAWNSLWVGANDRAMQRRTSLREALFDFNLGYALMLVTAVMFLVLGAQVLYGTGTEYAETNGAFANQLIGIYTQSLGDWAWPVIAVTAFAAMFSTTITVIDAYPRSIAAGIELLIPGYPVRGPRNYVLWIVLVGLGGGLIIFFFVRNLRQLIDFVTILAFLTAPFFAWLNLKLIRSDLLPKACRPGPLIRWLSYAGLAFFIAFSLLFLVTRFFPLT